jgi:hypothetical protein
MIVFVVYIRPIFKLKDQNPGFSNWPNEPGNIPVVQKNKQTDFGFSGMFNYEVIQVYI